MPSNHDFPYRPLDFMYDPIFTVSGPRDHYKAAMVAKMSEAKFQICPIFPNMFSDHPNYPRVQLVKRRDKPMPSFAELLLSKKRSKDPHMHREVDVRGADRSKFCVAVINFPPKDALPYQTFPTFTIKKIEKKVTDEDESKTKDVEVETIFRESIAQTDPWEPPYKIIGKGDPEILKLDFLKWGSGLPAGMHEIALIERARMKIAWEKDISPDVNDEQSITQFREYLQALEIDEWAFREREISEVQELRLQLLENMLNEIHEASDLRIQTKMNNVIERIQKDKEEKLAKINKQTARELRKLETQRRGFQRRYKEMNIVDEHVDKKSEIYVPLIRHGQHPKRWHLVIDEKLKQYRAQFIGVENISTLPKWLDQATKIDKSTLYSNYAKRRLCIRETKWTAPVLKKLHEILKDLRTGAEKPSRSLRTRVKMSIEESRTSEVEGPPEEEENLYQAVLVLQKMIKGRASQSTTYEGRDTCKELVLELKHSKGLIKAQKDRRRKEKHKVKTEQREEIIQMNMVEKLQGSLGRLQGIVVGSLLDFLNKELRRLLEERKAHAMCLINERERYTREAVEAGRRQKELRRRREHDEMFKQIVKITQDSIDVYLKDIITEGLEFSSKKEASEYIEKLASQIENEAEKEFEKESTVNEEDELIANLVLHFVLPDVQKKIIREKISNIQKHRLKTIHDSIYSNFEELPAPVYPEEPIEEIVADIIEELKQRLEDELDQNDIKLGLQEVEAVDEVLSITYGVDDTVRKSIKSSKRSSKSRSTKSDHRDDIEIYMSHLLQEAGEGEYDDGFDLYPYQGDPEDISFKTTLATIPEDDNESSVRD